MEFFREGLFEAYHLIVSLDPLVMGAALRTVWISTLAVAVATIIGLPVGTFLAQVRFPGRTLIVLIFRAGMAVPTVFIGLICYGLFSRQGPAGALELLFEPWAIVIGEFLLALPIVLSITHGAIKSLDARVGETALTLGASRVRRWQTYVSEARRGVMLAVLTAFARCVTELGIAMMVGGNIRGRTRTLATATALETVQGEFARAMAMGVILLLIAVLVMVVIVGLGRENETK